MLPDVKICPTALVQMLCASVEPFKKECLGILFGSLPTKNENQFVIAFVQTLGCVHRKGFNEISTNTKSWQRLENFISCLPRPFGYFGDFHSHNEWGTIDPPDEMSMFDIERMRMKNDALEIIIAVSSCRKNPNPWFVDEDGSLRGSFGSKQKMYNFIISAYVLDSNDLDDVQKPKPKKIKIAAPEFIKSFNRALECRSARIRKS